MSVPSSEARREAEAAMAARRDLGLEYDEQIAAGLAQRVEHIVAHHQHDNGNRQTQIELAEFREERSIRAQQLALSITSLGTGIPITGIAAATVEPGLLGIGVSWAGIVAVNVVFAVTQRRRRRDSR